MLRKQNKELLAQIKLDRENLSKTSTATSSTHVMSKEDYLSIYENVMTYKSVRISYNRDITNEEEQVVVVIGM